MVWCNREITAVFRGYGLQKLARRVGPGPGVVMLGLALQRDNNCSLNTDKLRKELELSQVCTVPKIIDFPR